MAIDLIFPGPFFLADIRDKDKLYRGTKPGEKMYEELLNTEETRRAWELERYFSILPAFLSIYRNINYDYNEIISKEVNNSYGSGNEPPLSKGALAAFLKENNLLTSNHNQN